MSKEITLENKRKKKKKKKDRKEKDLRGRLSNFLQLFTYKKEKEERKKNACIL